MKKLNKEWVALEVPLAMGSDDDIMYFRASEISHLKAKNEHKTMVWLKGNEGPFIANCNHKDLLDELGAFSWEIPV